MCWETDVRGQRASMRKVRVAFAALFVTGVVLTFCQHAVNWWLALGDSTDPSGDAVQRNEIDKRFRSVLESHTPESLQALLDPHHGDEAAGPVLPRLENIVPAARAEAEAQGCFGASAEARATLSPLYSHRVSEARATALSAQPSR